MHDSETILMDYFEMPEGTYEELKRGCDEEASFLKRSFMGEDAPPETVEQRYPSDIASYLRAFLRDC